MNIINLTPHALNIFLPDGSTITIEPSGVIARCSVERERVGEINGIPVNQTVFGQIENLPEPQENTIYVVSTIVAQAVSGTRNDVYVPDDVVRDEQGRIIGCKALARI